MPVASYEVISVGIQIKLETNATVYKISGRELL